MTATCLSVSEIAATVRFYRKQARHATLNGQRHLASEWLRGADWFRHLGDALYHSARRVS